MPPVQVRRRAGAAALAAAGLIDAWYLASGWRGWVSPARLVVTGALAASIAGGVALLWTGSRHRRLLGALLLLVGTGLLLLDLPKVLVLAPSLGPMPYVALVAAGTGIGGIGVLMRRRRARWLALGLAAAGGLSSGLNLYQWMAARVVDPSGWALSIWTLGSLVILAMLTGQDVAAEDRTAARDEVWTQRHPLVGWMRAAIISSIAAGMMLVVYAFLQQDAVPALTRPAMALSGLLAVAALLASRGQVLGGVLLTIGAVGLVALSAALWTMAPPGMLGLRIAGFYLVFWMPAAICGLGCGVATARFYRR